MPFQVLNPMEAMQVGADRARANRLADIQEADILRARRQEEMLNQLYQQAYNPQTGQIDTNRLYGGLAAQGMGTNIPKMQAAEAELMAKRATAAKTTAEVPKQIWENARNELSLIDLKKDPNAQERYRAWGTRLIQQAPWTANLLPATLDADSQQRLLTTADKAIEKHFVTQDLGGTTQVLAMPKYGDGAATVVPGSVATVTASPNRPQTNVITKLEGAESTEKGKLNVEVYKSIQSTANAARALAPKLTAIRATLDKGFETGQFAPIKTEAAAFLSAIGVKDSIDPATGKKVGPLQYATDAQKFKAIAQERVLERQLEQKGVQTTSDAARMEQTFARLGNTTEANRFLVDVADAQGKMAIKQQKFWDDWWNKNRTYEGVEQAWNEGEGSKSIFDSPKMARYLESTGGKITVTAPNGKVYEFADQKAADNFKKAARIK